ncbi:MAG: PAS domain S-box protein [Vicingaceae bacterium]
MNKIEVLLIESSESDALIIAEYLLESKTEQYEITHLINLEEANTFLSDSTVDIIIVNLFLPDSYGIHTFNHLINKYSDKPFLILTDMKDHLIGINTVKKGAQDFLIKDEINSSILSRSINYAIERKIAEKELRKSEEKYRELFERSKDAIYMSTVDGDFVDINTAGLSLFGYKKDDMANLKVKDLYHNKADRDHLKEVLAAKGEVSDYNIDLVKKDQVTVLKCLLSTMVIKDEHQKIIGYQGIIKDISDKKKAEKALIKSLQDLDQANKELLHLNATLEEKVNERTIDLVKEKELGESQHKEILESIRYAKRIQASILPPMKKIKSSLPESFIYYEPKDVVSGDFYWYEEVNKKPLFAVVDCTGHGVPGAFMSIIGYTQLNEIISEQKISTPGVILKELDKRVKLALNQNNKEAKNSKDGMELGIMMVNYDQKKLEYSGAMRPLYMVKDGDLHIVKGNKFSIGGSSFRKKEFITTRINIEKGDCFYLFSDGYPDQFGGPRGKKFMTRHVGEMLQGIAHLPMAEQGRVVKKTIKDWMGNEEQVDDILITGIKF